MTYISKLQVSAFRNLGSISIEPSPSLNILYGENGAGKTSLLEAIHYLSRAKSFRTSRAKSLVQSRAGEFVVFSEISNQFETSAQSSVTKLGVSRSSAGKQKFQIDGEKVRSAAELARALPVLSMNSDSFLLLEGSPSVRRQFLDWLVFHVKHSFAPAWKTYSHALKQRNRLLKHGKMSDELIDPWDVTLARSGSVIEIQRRRVFKDFCEHLISYLSECELSFAGQFQLEYIDGWQQDRRDLSEFVTSDELEAEKFYLQCLQAVRDKDCRYGYTSIGSHKSDLAIRLGDSLAKEVLSRGERKTFIAAMSFAKAKAFKELTRCNSLYLLDDLPAEMDSINLKTVFTWLKDTDSQLFVTSVNRPSIENLAWDNQFKMFHVKHGELIEETS